MNKLSVKLKINNKNQSIKVISRATDILRALGEKPDGLSLGQIAKMANLPRSTVQRIVNALQVEGLVSTERGNGGIRLGSEIQRLAQVLMTDIVVRMRPVMTAISEQTGETVDLSILRGKKMLFKDQIVGNQRLRAESGVGDTFPLTTTANGKSALSCLDQTSAIKIILAENDEMGHSGAPIAGLLKELEHVNSGGLALDEGQHSEDICALGFPIKDVNGDILALSVPMPSSRYARKKNELKTILLHWRKELGT